MNFRFYNTKTLVSFILFLSVICGFISTKIISLLSTLNILSQTFLELGSLLGITSTSGLVLLSLKFIDTHGWKYRIFRPLVKNIPNLNGRYEGELDGNILLEKDAHKYTNATKMSEVGKTIKPQSEYILGNKKMQCVIEITQTASKISVSEYYKDPQTPNKLSSTSKSIFEDLDPDDQGNYYLTYVFTNEPKPHNKPMLDTHTGTKKLKYLPLERKLSGDYFNTRRNLGSVEVSFKTKKLFGTFDIPKDQNT